MLVIEKFAISPLTLLVEYVKVVRPGGRSRQCLLVVQAGSVACCFLLFGAAGDFVLVVCVVMRFLQVDA